VLKVLVVDVGGSHIKLWATGHRKPIKIPSGPSMTAREMVRDAKKAARNWTYDVVSIGYPGVVLLGKIATEPHNLGGGWVGFNFSRAFRRPVIVINDAAMQALGSYRTGRMLFLGLGTGLGAAVIADGIVVPTELAHLPYLKGRTYEDYVGQVGLRRLGKKKWRRHVNDVVTRLRDALEVDDVVVGGGNAKKLKTLPRGVRRGAPANVFLGGVSLWNEKRQEKRATTHGQSRAVLRS
jgi:predicted NBD/HSP70 family sugar kinase